MGSAADEMFKPRAVIFFLVVLLACLVQTIESKTKSDDNTPFTVNQMAKYHQHLLERFHGVELAIIATIREGKPGLCTTCWYKTSYYNCTDITPSNLARCRQQACPRCRYDERCTHDWCGPPTTTSTTTTATTTITSTTETTPPTTSVTTTDDTTTDNKDS